MSDAMSELDNITHLSQSVEKLEQINKEVQQLLKILPTTKDKYKSDENPTAQQINSLLMQGVKIIQLPVTGHNDKKLVQEIKRQTRRINGQIAMASKLYEQFGWQ